MSNPDPHCKIGKITIKETGTVIRVFESRAYIESQRLKSRLKQSVVDRIADIGANTGGFIILLWDREGAYTVDWDFNAALHTLGVNTLPEYVAGAVRREISDIDMRRVLDPEVGD